MSASISVNLTEPGPRPPFLTLAEHLWGPGCNIDSDGDSRSPADTMWTEFTAILRPDREIRVDIDPVSLQPLVLCIRASSMELAEKAALFLVHSSGGTLGEFRTA